MLQIDLISFDQIKNVIVIFYLLDYLPFITLQKRTNPSNEMFVVALLSEIIRYLAPNHSEFRSKISYAAFLLQLIVGESESYSVIDIFHKVCRNKIVEQLLYN